MGRSCICKHLNLIDTIITVKLSCDLRGKTKWSQCKLHPIESVYQDERLPIQSQSKAVKIEAGPIKTSTTIPPAVRCTECNLLYVAVNTMDCTQL